VKTSPASSTTSRVSSCIVTHTVPRVTRSVVPRAPSSFSISPAARSKISV
jgi:hypothetical protein